MSVNISVSQSGIHISLNAIVKELGKQTRDVCHGLHVYACSPFGEHAMSIVCAHQNQSRN
eukprot:scaffold64249_cov16-Tisochrysis_lutea.AAC.3